MSRVLPLIVAVALLATACGANTAAAATTVETAGKPAPVAVAIAQTDPVEDVESGHDICTDLAVVYRARSRFRAALAIDPAERHELSWYVGPISSVENDLFQRYRNSTEAPPFSIDALSALYNAERSLAYRIDDRRVLNRADVENHETEAREVHDFARENCPAISGIDMASVLELVPVTDEAEVRQLRDAFCSNVSALLATRSFVRESVDDLDGLQPLTSEIARAMQEMVDHAEAIAEIFAEQHAIIDPEGDLGTGPLWPIVYAEVRVRQANFEPVAMPIPVPEGGEVAAADNTDADALGSFVATTCPDLDQGLLLLPTDPSLLPGPTFPALPYAITAEHLCITTERAIEARSGYHAAIRRQLDGDPYAVADARWYRLSFLRSASYGGVPDAFEAAFPDADEELTRSWATVESVIQTAFEGSGTDREEVLLALDRLSVFVEMVRSVCPEIDALAFGAVDETLALFDLLHVNYELPAVADTEVLCTHLDRIFDLRVAVRAGIEAGDTSAVNNAQYRIYNEAAYDVELPAGFDVAWVASLGSVERELYYRFEFDSPQTTQDILTWEKDIALLVDWVRSNCSASSAGLDLNSTLEVFPRPSVIDVERAQGEFCSAVGDLYGARVEFRSYVGQPQDDFPAAARSAYLAIIVSAEQVERSWLEHLLLVDPDGIAKFRDIGQAVRRTESMVRQAHFGPNRIPMTLNDDYAAKMDAHLANFVSQICDELADGATELTALADLDGPRHVKPDWDGPESELAAGYCPSLEVALLARFNFVNHLRAAAQDPDTALDATQFYNRLFNVSYANQIDAAFGKGDRHSGPLLVPNPSGLPAILARAAAGESTFDDRWDVEDALARTEVIDPRAIAQCPEIRGELFDFAIPDALQILDDLVAAQP